MTKLRGRMGSRIAAALQVKTGSALSAHDPAKLRVFIWSNKTESETAESETGRAICCTNSEIKLVFWQMARYVTILHDASDFRMAACMQSNCQNSTRSIFVWYEEATKSIVLYVLVPIHIFQEAIAESSSLSLGNWESRLVPSWVSSGSDRESMHDFVIYFALFLQF